MALSLPLQLGKAASERHSHDLFCIFFIYITGLRCEGVWWCPYLVRIIPFPVQAPSTRYEYSYSVQACLVLLLALLLGPQLFVLGRRIPMQRHAIRMRTPVVSVVSRMSSPTTWVHTRGPSTLGSTAAGCSAKLRGYLSNSYEYFGPIKKPVVAHRPRSLVAPGRWGR